MWVYSKIKSGISMVYIIKKCLENVCQIKKLYCKKSQMEYKKYTLRDQVHIEEIKTWE